MTDIPKWLYANTVVKVVATGKPVLVTAVYESGNVDARTPRATHDDLIGSPAASFAPAALEDRILFELDRAHCDMTDAIITKGDSNSDYTISFPAVHQIKLPADQIKKRCQFISVEQMNRILVVKIPSLWEVKEAIAKQAVAPDEGEAETEVDRWREADEASAIAESLIEDESLAEITRLNRELQDRNAALVFERDTLKVALEETETLADQRLTMIDSLRGQLNTRDQLVAAPDETLISNQPLPTCKQWDIELSASIVTLNTRESQGWEIAHMEFELGKLNVVYYRVQSAPAPTNGVPADSHGAQHRHPERVTTFPLNQHGTPPRNYGDIARQNAAATGFEIPAYKTPPLGMNRDERIEWRLDQIRAAEEQFVRTRVGGQS